MSAAPWNGGTVRHMCGNGGILPDVPLNEAGRKMLRDTFEYLYIRAMVFQDERKMIVPALSACHLMAVVAKCPSEDLLFMKGAVITMIDAYHNGDEMPPEYDEF